MLVMLVDVVLEVHSTLCILVSIWGVISMMRITDTTEINRCLESENQAVNVMSLHVQTVNLSDSVEEGGLKELE